VDLLYSDFYSLCFHYLLIGIHYTVPTLIFLSLSHLAVACSLLGGPDSLGFVCSGSEAWIEVEPSTEDQAFLSEQAD